MNFNRPGRLPATSVSAVSMAASVRSRVRTPIYYGRGDGALQVLPAPRQKVGRLSCERRWAEMGRDGWFDGKGIDLLRDDFLEDHAGWQRYIADGQITAAEILEQESRITQMLREVEPTLTDEQHESLTKVLLEYEVLVNMALVHYPSVMDAERYWSISFREV